MDILSQVVAAAATGAEQSNIVTVNKNRAGAAVHDAYAIKDFLDANRMAFFLLGVLGLAASGYGIKVRKTGEARLLYALTGMASLAAIWTFRPGVDLGQSTAAATGAPAAAGGGSAYSESTFLRYLDDRAAILGQQDPNFAAESLSRLLTDVGGGNIPALAALVNPS